MLVIDTRSECSEAQRQPTCTAGATLPERLCSAELPTGTVTFLLTDIQGSTRLWDTHPREMRLATVQHDHLIESTVARHAGTVVRPRGEGDSRFAVFRRASDAIAAAADIQFGLAHENWDLPEPLRVHLGLHTGEADVREGDYYGSAVNRCARLRTLAHGGQILLSGATFDVVQDAPDGWPAGTTPRPLGEHRLAGLSRPERIFELVVDGLPSAFPLLAVASEPPTNLPGEVTTFFGRERELALLEHRLLDSKVRLITLVGPGGVGKTRLAQQVARNVIGAFSDGIYFVSLAAITGPHLVASAIAQTLGILDGSNKPVVETLVARLREQELLLVLDNFEQVRIAGPTVATLLKACSRLKVLATSRSLLHLTGEHRLEVAPLGIPPANVAPSVAERAESVRLFIDRAQAADAEFSHTPRNSAAVQSICRTLEGLPLAIELVAARVRDFPPGALAAHLERHRLALLTGGPSDAPQRHQTLRAAIGWSHALLTPEEQTLFRQLAVFAGGCAPEAAQMVCRLTGDAFQVESTLGDSRRRACCASNAGRKPSRGSECWRQFESLPSNSLTQVKTPIQLASDTRTCSATFWRPRPDTAMDPMRVCGCSVSPPTWTICAPPGAGPSTRRKVSLRCAWRMPRCRF
jgi:predicted ATPase/class 3 adenylate cyclase